MGKESIYDNEYDLDDIDISSLTDEEYDFIVNNEIEKGIDKGKNTTEEERRKAREIEPNSIPQELALNNTVYNVLYGGAVGGGKSFVILLRIMYIYYIAKSIREKRDEHNLNSKPPSFLIIRKDLPGLNEMIKTSYMLFSTMGEFNISKKTWKLKDGTEIIFGFIKDEKSFNKFQGQEYTGIYIDEAGQYTADEFYNIDLLKTRIRNTNGYFSDFMMTANPGGPGHHTLIKRYNIGNGSKCVNNIFYKGKLLTKDDPKYNEKIKDEENISRNCFIPATAKDNPEIPDSYTDSIENSSLPDYMKRALIDGLWLVAEGGMFEDLFDDNIHVIPYQGVEIPKNWKFTRGYDYGRTSPYASLIFAENNGGGDLVINGEIVKTPRGTIIVLAEDYRLLDGKPNKGDGSGVQEQAIRFVQLEESVKSLYGIREIQAGYADNQIYTGDDGKTQADTFKKYNIFFKPSAKGTRAIGWGKIRDLLKNTIDSKKEGIDNKRPHLYIIDLCEHTIRTFKSVQRDVKKNNGDLVDNDEDHLLDVIRYNAYENPVSKRRTRREVVGVG